jgi:hypothetical protein
MGYPSFPTQIPPPDQTQSQQINVPQFYYPTAPMQPPTDMWHTQSVGLLDAESTQPAMNDYSQMRQLVYSAPSNMPQGPQATMQTAPQMTRPIGQTAEEYASNLSPVPAQNPALGIRNREVDRIPQVLKLHSFSGLSWWHAYQKSLDGPAAADDISLSATAWSIAPTITIL